MEHLTKLLHAPSEPGIPAELEDLTTLHDVHDYLIELRNLLSAFSRGDLSSSIKLRGVIAGRLKALQASIYHLTWQIQQVADGDFSQRIDFLGEFSIAFNSMVEQFYATLQALQQKDEELTSLTLALQDEIEQKSLAMAALRESEATFRHLAEYDTLTEVFNRRSFYNFAPIELLRSREKNRHCSVAIFDIDHFKRFNDSYGHLEGDAALRHITKIIKAGLRQNDIIARYGGEEFVLLFPLTHPGVSKNIAERLRESVAKSPVKTFFGDVPVTISIGIVDVPPDLQNLPSLEEALRYADEALYKAKEAGRNRLVSVPWP